MMRLDKFVAHASGYSRSDVKRLLRAGHVTVNGILQKDPGLEIQVSDEVMLDDGLLALPGERYFMLHKPAGYVSATEDGGHLTVLDLMPAEQREGLMVAGRLDIDTTGLVLLTDDGQWSHRVRRPGGSFKRYRVQLKESLSADAQIRFAQGILLNGEDKPTLPARLELLAERECRVWISEGRYHQVKRMFAAIGNHVAGLHREAVGDIELDKDLQPGQWRRLSAAEIASVSVAK